MNKQPSMTSLTNLPHPNFLESTLSKSEKRLIFFIEETKAANVRHQSNSKVAINLQSAQNTLVTCTS